MWRSTVLDPKECAKRKCPYAFIAPLLERLDVQEVDD